MHTGATTSARTADLPTLRRLRPRGRQSTVRPILHLLPRRPPLRRKGYDMKKRPWYLCSHRRRRTHFMEILAMMRTVPLKIHAGRLAGIDRKKVVVVVMRAIVVDVRGSDGQKIIVGRIGLGHSSFKKLSVGR